MIKGLFSALLLVFVTPPLAWCAELVSHRFEIVLVPDDASIEVTDHIEVPASLVDADGGVEFSLNRNFSPVVDGLALRGLASDPQRPSIRRFRLLLDGSRRFSLRYSGRLSNQQAYEAGHIGPEGVYLSGSGAWYPRFGQALHRFTMRVEMPPGWRVVSQGRPGNGPDPLDWVASQPQDDIYLIAAPWTVFTRPSPLAEAQVYLRDNDAELAGRYLDATQQYLAFYNNLLGAYPYPKFALVENFWETGYGMPSFTLLGSAVIRLPFIIHTSYPHEIVHNWWGNGVYVDYEDGNWSEGLTAYLADHLLHELKGLGYDYRRDALQKYRSYVSAAEDFPLRRFVGKHGEASQAIGYNKALMFFHMLRRTLGERTFLAGLRHFYTTHRFERAGYRHLRAAFEQVSGEDLESMFDQWTRRVGAPVLALEAVAVHEVDDGFRVEARLRQTQSGTPYELDVPVVVQTADGLREVTVHLDDTTLDFGIDLQSPPIRLVVDPRFDLFRRLDVSELPASLDELLSNRDGLALIPRDIDEEHRDTYRQLALDLGVATISDDHEADGLPEDKVVWLLGWENRFLQPMSRLLKGGTSHLTAQQVTVDTRVLDRDQSCVLVVARRKTNPNPIGFIGCDRPEITSSLARRLRHYGKYSYLGFDTESGRNVLKGSWTVTDSVMVFASWSTPMCRY